MLSAASSPIFSKIRKHEGNQGKEITLSSHVTHALRQPNGTTTVLFGGGDGAPSGGATAGASPGEGTLLPNLAVTSAHRRSLKTQGSSTLEEFTRELSLNTGN